MAEGGVTGVDADLLTEVKTQRACKRGATICILIPIVDNDSFFFKKKYFSYSVYLGDDERPQVRRLSHLRTGLCSLALTNV